MVIVQTDMENLTINEHFSLKAMKMSGKKTP